MPGARLRALALAAALASPSAAAELEVEALYVERSAPPPATLSNLDRPPQDLGLAGARLALEDNAATGRFLDQTHGLTELIVDEGVPFLPAVRAALAAPGGGLIVANLAAADLLALADLPEAQGVLILNARAADNSLRDSECRANVLHVAPSRAMLADALTQALVKKRWTDWFLVVGQRDRDGAFAAALRRSADKFGARIREDKTWPFDADMRRSAGSEAPVFTQGADHDVLVVADEPNDFARYLPYNTWRPRPIAGSEGLVPAAWSRVVEQWGAAQLNARFEALAHRDMRAEDWSAWAALRAIAEAATRAGSADPAAIRAALLSPDFALAVFKGRPASFRPWNGQMRQPVPLVTRGAMVDTAPLEGFLHARTELDTIGLDEPESRCEAFR